MYHSEQYSEEDRISMHELVFGIIKKWNLYGYFQTY